IADDSPSSFVGKPDGVTGGSGSGASITIGSVQSLPGSVFFPSSNHSTYSGATTVQNGTFILDGSIVSPVTVMNGAKLQGVGTVNQSVTINMGGRFHAGNSIGQFTVGSLHLPSSQSILELDIDLTPGSNLSSVYIVNGSVSLNDATLQLNLLNPNSVQVNHTYQFLSYTGGIAGAFGTIGSVPLGFFVTITQAATNTTLNLIPFTSLGAGISLPHNEQVVLSYLLNFYMVPSLQFIFQDLGNLTPEQLETALNSISPARNGAAPYFANQTAFTMGYIPLGRLHDKRILSHRMLKTNNNSMTAAFNTKSASLLALAENGPHSNLPANLDQTLAQEPGAKESGNEENKPAGRARTMAAKPERFSVWATGFGDFLSQDGMHSNPKIRDTASGAVIGFDYYGCQNGIFTLSAGYLHNDIKESGHLGSGTSQGGMLSLYGTGYIGDGYIEGGALGGYHRFHMKRNISIPAPTPFFETAQSSFNDWVLMPHLGGGYDWMMNWGVVEPFTSFDWAMSFQETYKEKGASPLNTQIKSQSPSILRSQVGMNVYETWDKEKHSILIQESVSYVNKTFFNTKMKAALIIAPSSMPAGAPSPFTVQTYDRMLNLVGVGAELFYKHKPSGFFLSAAYQGEFGNGYKSNDIMGTLGIFF
ncbi:MAG TPA: autotransporter domain-containing protein, partial [Chlamydiales bacterium]|nr:autotransporter domain-containing protein [Chlamydiales bacterium]